MKRTLLFSLPLLPVASLFAQPAGNGQELSTSLSYSSSAELKGDGGSAGDLSLFFANAKVGLGSFEIANGQLSYGVEGSLVSIDGETRSPLPDDLASGALSLSYATRISENRTVIAGTSLGQYGTGFNASGLALLQTKESDSLSWSVGALFDIQGKYPVLPIVGVVWQATPEITVRVGAPRAEIAYKLNPELSASFGVGAAGGTYRTGAAGRSASGKALDHTWVDIREIRVGPGLAWRASDALSVRVEAGWVADRRFEFDDRDVTLRTEDAAYAGLSGVFRF